MCPDAPGVTLTRYHEDTLLVMFMMSVAFCICQMPLPWRRGRRPHPSSAGWSATSFVDVLVILLSNRRAFRTYLYINNILPHAKRRDDLVTLREAGHRHNSSSEPICS